MSRKILQFPCPDHGLSSEQFAFEVTKLTDELASTLAGGEERDDHRLERIERASILLNNIGLLVSRGSDRKRAIKAFEQIMHSIDELKSRLRKHPQSSHFDRS